MGEVCLVLRLWEAGGLQKEARASGRAKGRLRPGSPSLIWVCSHQPGCLGSLCRVSQKQCKANKQKSDLKKKKKERKIQVRQNRETTVYSRPTSVHGAGGRVPLLLTRSRPRACAPKAQLDSTPGEEAPGPPSTCPGQCHGLSSLAETFACPPADEEVSRNQVHLAVAVFPGSL